MITNYVINCGYKHNTFKNEIFLLDKNIQLRYQAEGLNVSVYSTTDNIDRIYFNEIEYSQNENDYGKYRFENNLTITFYENPNISFYDIIKKIAIKDYYLILKDYKNNYFLVNADNGYDLTYKISISDNSEEINTLTIEIKSVSNHPLMIFNDFKFNIINFSEKPCDYIDNSISSIKWSFANNISFDKEVGIKINDLSKLYNIDYLEDSFTFEEELNDNGSIITNIKLNIPLDNNQFSFSYNLLEYTDNRYKMFFITKNGNLFFTSGKLSVRYDITSNNDSEINYVTLTFSSTNNMFNSGGNGDFSNTIWIATEESKCEGFDLYKLYQKYIINNNILYPKEEFKYLLYETNSCECGYFEFGDWYPIEEYKCGSELGEEYVSTTKYQKYLKDKICGDNIIEKGAKFNWQVYNDKACDCGYSELGKWYESKNEFKCGSELGEGFIPTNKYQKWYQDKICGDNIIEEKVESQWVIFENSSCECGYYDTTDWMDIEEYKCGSELGEEYVSTTKYQKRVKYGICNGEINYDIIAESQWNPIQNNSYECGFYDSVTDWITVEEYKCGSELNEEYVSTTKYQKQVKYGICNGEINYDIIVETKWVIFETNSCECGYYDSVTDWVTVEEYKCGSELGEEYVSTTKYQKQVKYGICNGETNYNTIAEVQWLEYEAESYDCGFYSWSDWYDSNEFKCGFELGLDYTLTTQYQKQYRDKIYVDMSIEEKADFRWVEYVTNSCDCGYYDGISTWVDDIVICGVAISDEYPPNNKYQRQVRYKTCGGRPVGVYDYQYILLEENSYDCGFLNVKYKLVTPNVCGEESFPPNTEIVTEINNDDIIE